MTPKEAAEKLVRYLDGVPRARAELLEASGITEDLWLPAIRELVESGAATRIGNKRGARYLAGSFGFQPVAVRETTSVAESHCGLIERILIDLATTGTQADAVADSEDLQSWQQSVDDNGRDDPVDNANDNSLSDIPSMLSARGEIELIDHRAKGGCLWVIGGPGVDQIVDSVANETGARFNFKAEGAKSTGWRPAWWTVAR